MSDRTDATLVNAIASGDHASLNEVYSRYGDAVYGIASRLCGQQLAEQIVTSVFLGLWQHPDAHDADRRSLRADLVSQAHSEATQVVMSNLPPRAGHAVALAYFGGLTYLEIADELELSPETVAELLTTGLIDLRSGAGIRTEPDEVLGGRR